MYLEIIRHFGTYSNLIQLKTKPKKTEKKQKNKQLRIVYNICF